MNIEVPQSAIVLELLVSGNSKEIAEKLNSSETIKAINQSSPTEMNYYGFENKLYVVLKTLFEIPEEEFAVAKPSDPNDTAKIHLTIHSQNDLTRISELLKEKGAIGLLDSLEVNFEFAKTKSTEGVIVVILQQMGFGGIDQVIQSFRRINFELNGASSNILNEFPKIKF